jgi:hypothetical protein
LEGVTVTLERLAAGRRFALAEMREVTGRLVAVGEGSALVELDGAPSFRSFETADGRTVCISSSGKHRTTITKLVDVVPL